LDTVTSRVPDAATERFGIGPAADRTSGPPAARERRTRRKVATESDSGGAEVSGAPSEPTTVDEAATLEDLLIPVLPRAHVFAMRLTRDEADAEDLLQEAAVRACRFFHQFEPGTNFRAWFFKILANCFYGRERTVKRRGPHLSLDGTPGLYLFAQVASPEVYRGEVNPADELMSRVDAEEIARAMDELPEPYRAVATLYLVEDLKYAEIADVLDLPVGTVRSRLHRGRRMLQRQLWDLAAQHGLVSEDTGE
jgi:RNA polymerase sigma-70 factor (ECF subfamily)